MTVNLTKNSEYRDRTLVHFERIPKNVTHPAGLTGLQNGLLIFLWDTEQSFTFPASDFSNRLGKFGRLISTKSF